MIVPRPVVSEALALDGPTNQVDVDRSIGSDRHGKLEGRERAAAVSIGESDDGLCCVLPKLDHLPDAILARQRTMEQLMNLIGSERLESEDLRTSLTPTSVAESWTNRALERSAMMRPTVVFPVPGGPQKSRAR